MRSMSIQKTDGVKGIVLLLSGTVCLSLIPIIAKLALMEVPSLHFSASWMIGGGLWSALWALRKGVTEPIQVIRQGWKPLVLTGFFASGWVFFYFSGLSRLDPAVATFLINSRILWALIIGVVFLHERYTVSQTMAIAIVAAGVVTVFLDADSGVETAGMLFMVVAAVFYVLTNTTVKRGAMRFGVELSLFARFFFPAIVLIVASVVSGIAVSWLTPRNVSLILGGSLVGPFLSFLLIFSALKYLDLALHTVFQSIAIALTAVLTFVVFGTVPSVSRLLGGTLIVVGIVFLGVFSIRREKRSRFLEDPTQRG